MVNPHRLPQSSQVSESKTVRRKGDRRLGRLFRSASIFQPEGTSGAKKALRLSPTLESGQE